MMATISVIVVMVTKRVKIERVKMMKRVRGEG